MNNLAKDRLKMYGSKESIEKRAEKGSNACGSCGSRDTLRIYNSWGEAVLCNYCGAVTEEGIQDAMSGVHGSMFIYYNTYEDFLSLRKNSVDNSGIGYH